MSSADEAAEGVAAHLERERGMMVVVERTQALMPLDSQSEPLRDPLNGQVAKLLKFKLIHNCQLSIVNYQLSITKIFLCLRIKSCQFRVGDELAVLPHAQLAFSTILRLIDTYTKRF